MSSLPRRPGASSSAAERTGAFYRQWLKRPLEVAALSPSGPQLSAAVAAAAAGARRVLELGGGTGAVTGFLLDDGGAPRELTVIETNPSFARVLRERFPRAKVIEGDAREALRLVGEAGVRGAFDAVVSGLGMLTRPRAEQRQLLESMFDLLRPDGHVVQYTYSLRFPAAKGVLEEIGLEAERAAVAFFNLPPASVFVVRRRP